MWKYTHLELALGTVLGLIISAITLAVAEDNSTRIMAFCGVIIFLVLAYVLRINAPSDD